MHLRNKSLIIMGLIWTCYLVVNIIFYPLPLLDFLFVSILFAALMMLGLYRFEIATIENLITKLRGINLLPPYKTRVSDNDNAETKTISEHFNKLLMQLQINHENLEKRIYEKTERLHKKNIQLQQEVMERISLERKTAHNRETVSRLAYYDELTSLPNRIFFNEILNKAMNHAKRHKKFLAILYLDIDHFATYNEKLGYSAGDYILRETANRIKNTLRAEDILARLEGDEFIILLNDIGKEKFASTVAEKLIKATSSPIKIDNVEHQVTVSIGITLYPHDAHSLEDLMKKADEARAKAKQLGENHYQFYSQAIGKEAEEFKEIESALRDALKNNKLMLYYQPKLNIRIGHPSGIEALIRWMHPDHGFISPTKIISIADETGLYKEISSWTLHEACRANKKWQDDGYEHLTVAVNLSPKQFYDPGLLETIQSALTETNLNPRYLELEINESTIMDNTEESMKIMQALKTIGVQISIDHFGTGYTSISQLKQFPISVLKIDSSFIKGLPHSPNDNAIVNAFIAMAHNLGFEVIAEGVETAEQVQYLAIQNCDMVQGYFLSHPLPAQKVINQFKKLGDEVLL